MTIHAAKGLEFDVVFIAGCEDGIIPHARSLEEGEGNLEEERRLFYVAVTRARRRLLVSACLRRRKQNQTIDCVPSPFLQEIPPHLLQNCVGEAEFTEEEGDRVLREAELYVRRTGRGGEANLKTREEAEPI